MKKQPSLFCSVLFVATLVCSVGCSSSSNDKALLKNFFENYYANPFTMKDYEHTEIKTRIITDYAIRGLEGSYIAHYSFSCASGKITFSDSTSYVSFILSPSVLSTESVDIPVTVNVEVENAFNATYSMTCCYKPYTNYFADILLANQKIKKGYRTIDKTAIAWQTITSGHYYSDRTFSVDFSQDKCTYYVKKYEKTTGSPYNIKESNIFYYFGGNDPRIEGLTTGTFFVNGSTYTSKDTEDITSYYWFQRANDVFKQYGDTDRITQIS